MKKNLYYGFLHMFVSLTSILFVVGVTGVNLSMTFLAIGIGTIIFHLVTKNKLAVLMGVSGSYIAGMTYIAKTLGPEYIGFGVVGAGIIYIIFGILYKKFDFRFPQYILSMAVIFIALTLLPIGASLAKGNVFVTIGTLILVFLFRNSMWAMPIGLFGGTAIYYALNPFVVFRGDMVNTYFNFAIPKFSWMAFLSISVVAIAAAFEALGDMTNCANAQEIKIESEDYARGLVGNGLSSIIAGFLGAPPLTTYSENIGFIYLSGWKDATAQIITGLIYIIMAFIPQITTIFSFIPAQVFGSLLLYLFALIMVENLRNLIASNFSKEVILLMFLGFFGAQAIVPNVSPIAVAMIVGLAAVKLGK